MQISEEPFTANVIIDGDHNKADAVSRFLFLKNVPVESADISSASFFAFLQ